MAIRCYVYIRGLLFAIMRAPLFSPVAENTRVRDESMERRTENQPPSLTIVLRVVYIMNFLKRNRIRFCDRHCNKYERGELFPRRMFPTSHGFCKVRLNVPRSKRPFRREYRSYLYERIVRLTKTS